MKYVNIILTDKQHKELKQMALDKDTSMSDMIRQKMGIQDKYYGKGRSPKKE